ncbi:ATPase domain-containing protein [Halorubellus sp. PRR65]|uniref:ATPase domain-containing protein n=1 Tax=Halorubellus sp. PRR65 TaxID=3098148 RepID=UPI002B25F7FC|nr:ATPase domain-containing protein [Halorubellus sp. PRR65]
MSTAPHSRLSTGVEGLDDVLEGGLVPNRAYLLRGGPGMGKTILGEHFLTADDDATSLFVSLEESARNLESNAASVGIDLADVHVVDYSPDATEFGDGGAYDVFAPGDRGESLSERIRDAVEAHDPDRVFVDPLSRLRQFTSDDATFYEEVGAFTSYVRETGATLLFSTQPTMTSPDEELEFVADGSIELASERKGRTVSVRKHRGAAFQSGAHTVTIDGDGMHVYPKLVPDSRSREFDAAMQSTGVAELDQLLGGGISPGTVTVISGTTGVGKTTTAAQVAVAAAERGDRTVAYLFEEARDTFVHRADAIGMPVASMLDDDRFALETVEALAVSPDEFAAGVREEVEERGARVVVIDGIAGYRTAIRGADDDLVRELHALCRYLRGMGVTVLLTDDVHTVTGDFEPTSERISYLADNILFLRYLEHRGELRKAIGVLKKRSSDFERTLRAYEITATGIRIGDPLRELRGILTGTPDWSREDE